MPNPPATPAEPALTTDATGDQEMPQGGPPTEDRASRGRFYGFRALKSPGFRIYFAGMLLRGMAMWMPLVAIPWLAVELGATPAEQQRCVEPDGATAGDKHLSTLNHSDHQHSPIRELPTILVRDVTLRTAGAPQRNCEKSADPTQGLRSRFRTHRST